MKSGRNVQSYIMLSLIVVGAAIVVVSIAMNGIVRTSAGSSTGVEDTFSAFERASDERDRVPDEPAEFRAMVDNMDIERIRLLGETDHANYYVVESTANWVCLLRFPHTTSEEDGVISNGCSPAWHVAESGLSTGGSAGSGPLHIAYALPEGYETIVDATGQKVGDVEGQLATIALDVDGDEPHELIATGPEGELSLGEAGVRQH